jgi:Sodium:neurotransmitter symporter family
VILAYSWASHEPLTKGDYVYPEWADAIGWIIALIAILVSALQNIFFFVTDIVAK